MTIELYCSKITALKRGLEKPAAVSLRSRAMRPKPKLKGAAALEKSRKTKEAKVKGQVK